MKALNKRIVPALFAALILFFCPLKTNAAENVLDKQKQTAEYLNSLSAPGVGSIGGEWLVLGLARDGIFGAKKKDAYVQNVIDYIKEAGSEKLHRSKSTDNSRVIIALSSIGIDAGSIDGYDLTAPLEDVKYVTKQGVNGAVWALTALDTFRYKSSVRDDLIAEILSKQLESGGWNLGSGPADTDVSAMAVQALSPYYSFDSAVKASVDKALSYFNSVDINRVSPETCAQLITAYTALKKSPESTGAFERMMNFSVTNGFEHSKDGGYNQMATEQCYYALTAYKRFLNRERPLYDMRDVKNFSIDEFKTDDVTELQRFLANFDTDLKTSQKAFYDLNEDEKLTVNDVTALQRAIAGFDVYD